jgi:hypothetical protein
MVAVLEDRRAESDEKDMHYFWSQLNMAQKFSVAELQRFGYELEFVRRSPSFSLAVLRSGGRFAAVDEDGQIDTEPKIVFRN